ncbi:MAG: DUF3108 domain-containing protein [Gemmatimonadetes bacterium]|nr:DUF3108 domain-containing protein [Gemmatimonadota bacterium]
MRGKIAIALLALAGASALPGVLPAQQKVDAEVRPGSPSPDPTAAVVPFGPGERLEYQVKLGMFSAGEGYMTVAGVDTVRGRPTYHLDMGFKGGMLFAKVNDRYQSWLDTRDLVSLHFWRDVREVSYKSFKEFAIFPRERRWQQLDENHAEATDTDDPLDELSFIYWVRTLPLEVGQTYTSNRYFQKKGNPVQIRVLRRELKKVPAGEFNAIVVQPIIKSGGLFGEGGKAELFFTDDAARHLVYMRSEIPVVGSITLHLRRMSAGTPLSVAPPTARSGWD